MRRVDHIIIRPISTEKSAMAEAERNEYTFEVGLSATKIEVKEAVQSLFGVKVQAVRTQVVRGKMKRFGRYYGKRPNWKKAIITLAEGEELSAFSSL